MLGTFYRGFTCLLKVGLLLNSNRFIYCHDKGLMSFEQGKRDFLGMSVVEE